MCFGAIYWARPLKVVYANTRKDAENIGFDDKFIYDEVSKVGDKTHVKFEHVPLEEGITVFREWK